MPEMTLLDSSNLAAAGVDGDDLVVEFRNGGTYRYLGASGHLDALREAGSAGTYFAKFIRGAYAFRKLA